MPKQHVLGYFILQNDHPCVLNRLLDGRGALIVHHTEATLFRRNERSLQAAKKQAFAAVRRTLRTVKKIAQSGHLQFEHLSPHTIHPGKYTVHPCRSKHPTLLETLVGLRQEGDSRTTVEMDLSILLAPEQRPSPARDNSQYMAHYRARKKAKEAALLNEL